MIKCGCCNKEIKGKGKDLFSCISCKEIICLSCKIRERCKDCHEDNNIAEYFADKYRGSDKRIGEIRW